MLNDPNMSNRKFVTAMKDIFVGYLDSFQSNVFISYFNYHEPVVSS